MLKRDLPNEIIGQCCFSGIQRDPFQACFLGYQLAKKYNGKGLMREALEILIDWVFIEKNIHRIMNQPIKKTEIS
jgi:ribosomal-protein-alanine N-acetyltransferase